MLTAYVFLVAFASVLWPLGGTVAAIICIVAALGLALRSEIRTFLRSRGATSAR